MTGYRVRLALALALALACAAVVLWVAAATDPPPMPRPSPATAEWSQRGSGYASGFANALHVDRERAERTEAK